MSKKVVKTVEHCGTCEYSKENLEHEASVINEYLCPAKLTEAEARALNFFDQVFDIGETMPEDSREYAAARNLAWELKYQLANSKRLNLPISELCLQFYCALQNYSFSKNGINGFRLYARTVMILLESSSGRAEPLPIGPPRNEALFARTAGQA